MLRYLYRKIKSVATFVYRIACEKFCILNIDEYDPVKSQVLIRYFVRDVGFEAFVIGGEDVIPDFAKRMVRESLCGYHFIERRIWLPIRGYSDHDSLVAYIGDRRAVLTLNKKKYVKEVTISEIKEAFESDCSGEPEIGVDGGLWLLMDRDTQADDNGEHLYRYLMRNHPEQDIVFVLRRSSHDWGRLEKDGFNLVDYASDEHISAIKKCDKIISSHADWYIFEFNGFRVPRNIDFVFLQHGVSKDDISGWLNASRRIDCLTVTSESERDSMVNDMTRYKLTEKEVFLTGFARHDELFNRRENGFSKQVVAIMPTWRKSLAGSVIQGNCRTLNKNFMNTEYARAWQALLCHPGLSDMSQDVGFEIVFYPHANVQPYLPYFKIPESIKVCRHADMSIQNVFEKSAVLITDYSSVAFEMAYLNKPVIYYQFDAESVYNGSHTYRRGFFDYKKDGFGPVVDNVEDLLFNLGRIVRDGFGGELSYGDNAKRFFSYQDNLNCKRIYSSIKSLDESVPDDYVNESVLRSYVAEARRCGMEKYYRNRKSVLDRMSC